MTKIKIFVSDQVDRNYRDKKPLEPQVSHPSIITFASDDTAQCIRLLQKLDIHHFEVLS